jgi:hypothetical protein
MADLCETCRQWGSGDRESEETWIALTLWMASSCGQAPACARRCEARWGFPDKDLPLFYRLECGHYCEHHIGHCFCRCKEAGDEMSLPSEDQGGARWSVDHLFVDPDAIPTLVEVTPPERRRADVSCIEGSAPDRSVKIRSPCVPALITRTSVVRGYGANATLIAGPTCGFICGQDCGFVLRTSRYARRKRSAHNECPDAACRLEHARYNRCLTVLAAAVFGAAARSNSRLDS